MLSTHFATNCAIIVLYPTRTSTKEFCDTMATSITQYKIIVAGCMPKESYDNAREFLEKSGGSRKGSAEGSQKGS